MAEGELTIIVTDKDGATKTLDSQAPDPGDRPQGIQFSTQLGSGFYTAGFTLSWPLDADRDDIHLLDDVKVITASGDTVYEGFVAAMPRSTTADGRGTLTVTLAGYMATASGDPFTMIFIDRDLGAWGEMSIAQRVALIAATYNPDGGNLVAGVDETGASGIVSSRAGLNKPCNRYVYDAGMNNLIHGLHVHTQTLGNLGPGDTNLNVYALFWSDDAGANQILSADLKASTAFSQDISATPRRYVVFNWQYNVNGGTAGVDYSVRWQSIRVVGDHGITMITDVGSSLPTGIAASEVIKWVAGAHCPLLSTSGVQDTTYPISHLVFRERTKPYDAMLKVNSYHLWDLAVWEGRTLHYKPISLDDWDWEIRHDEAGNQIGLQGDEYTQLRNGIVVQFTNVETGHLEELLPVNNAELRDDSADNPFNEHGWTWYGDPYQIPYPTTEGNALELGRIRLLEDNQVKAPGSFTVQNTIRDREGNPQPVAKVRSGQRIRITSSVNLSDRPRLIQETSYTHDGRTVTIGVDSTLRVLDALIDRTATALQAAGLS